MAILVPEERSNCHDSDDIFILSREGDISELQCVKVLVPKQDLVVISIGKRPQVAKNGRQLAQGNHKIQRFRRKSEY